MPKLDLKYMLDYYNIKHKFIYKDKKHNRNKTNDCIFLSLVSKKNDGYNNIIYSTQYYPNLEDMVESTYLNLLHRAFIMHKKYDKI
jgi:hypothetical protein